MKTHTKIALIFFCVVSGALILLSLGVYFLTDRYSLRDFYKRLEIRAVVMARTTLDHEQASVQVLQEVREMHLEKLPEEREYYFRIADNDTFDSASNELSLPRSFFTSIVNNGEATHRVGNTCYAGVKYESRSGAYVVVVSADNYNNITLLSHLRNFLLIGISVTSILTLMISLTYSTKIFTPVKKITQQVREISSRSLHLRLDETQSDEIGELQRTFNNMLDRLEASFATQNNFVSNASHELNTPLTAIIGQAEVTLAKDRAPGEYVESLKVILSKAERLHEITRSLLYLAQTGFTGKLEADESLRADELLWEVKEMIDRMLPGNKVQLNLSMMPENPERLRIIGNQRLLQIALSNVVNNAIKYSNNEVVIVSVGTTETEVILSVKDRGIGIPESEIGFIYDPFFRAANTSPYEGYGIGLPLTRNILRLHHGTIRVTSKVNVGTVVELTIPIAK
ncbi:HAMP domain-containing sensor histidine kinase [Chryseolinea sp. T2]|uniref:sensor histidine kinase n=1 Tax=Chryseolinea sp. T2 TaxID=3129255 RepID=UPI0030772526